MSDLTQCSKWQSAIDHRVGRIRGQSAWNGYAEHRVQPISYNLNTVLRNCLTALFAASVKRKALENGAP
jgi:hypothetical protein